MTGPSARAATLLDDPAVVESRASSPWAAFAISAGSVFLVTVDSTVAVAAFPALREAFPAASPSDLSWVLNAYTVLYAALLVPAGRVVDLRGARPVFLAGLALFTVASVACGLATGPGFLIAARAGQAIGGALLSPASLALVLAAFAPERRIAVVGLWGAAGALGAAVGLSLGGVLTEAGGWRWAFLINLPIGAGLLLLAPLLLPRRTPGAGGERLDIPGVLLLLSGVGLITWTIVAPEEDGLATWAAALGGVVLLGLYILWAHGRANAAIDLSLFANPTYADATLATLTFGLAFSMMFLTSFLFLLGVWNLSEGLTGLAVSPGPVLAIVGAAASGRIVARAGHRVAIAGAALAYAGAQVWYWTMLSEATVYWRLWFPGQVLGGLATGVLLTALAGAAVRDLGPARFGVGGAVNTAVRNLGGILGTTLAVLLAGEAGADLDDFRSVFLVLAALGLLTALLGLRVPPQKD